MSAKELFKEIGIKLDWEYTKISVFGHFNGYFVVCGTNFYKKIISIDFDVSNEKKVNTLVERLMGKRKEHKTNYVAITEYGIVIFFKGIWTSATYQMFITIVEFVMEQLKILELKPTENLEI